MLFKDKLDNLFPHREAKGTLAFEKIERILEIKALFPNIDTDSIIKLWEKCEYNQIEPHDLIRLSTIESQGFLIHKDIKDTAIEINEYSYYENIMKKELFFDIKETNLPRDLSLEKRIAKFKIDENFINNIITNYENNNPNEDKLLEHIESKTSLDLENKKIFYPKKNDPEKTLGSILASLAIAENIGTQKKFNDLFKNEEQAKIENLKVRLISNAICSSLGLNAKIHKITADEKKNFIWGENREQAYKNINLLIKCAGRIADRTKLISTFNIHYHSQQIKQQEEQLNSFINKTTIDDTFEKNQAKYEERGRLADYIKNNISIASIIEDFTDNEIRKKGSNLVSNCISPSHSDTNPSMVIYSHSNKCQCYSCGFNATPLNAVMNIKNVNYIEAIDLIVDKYNIQNNFALIDTQANKEYDKNEYLKKIAIKYEVFIDDKIYKELNDSLDISQLKRIEKRLEEIEIKSKLYSKRESHIKTIEKEQARASSKIEIVGTNEIGSDYSALKYLTSKRGFKRFPTELKKVDLKLTNENGYEIKFQAVGFINNSNGIDSKGFKDDEYQGKPYTAGKKDITILNKQNIEKQNPIFIIAESQWDLIAFYNDDNCKNIYDNAVAIVLNGASNGINSTVDFVLENKGRYSGLVILNQADMINEKAMHSIKCGLSDITAVAQISYKDDEFENKSDVNDLLKNNENIHQRFCGKLEYIENRANNFKNTILK
jgi:hypothetical protein